MKKILSFCFLIFPIIFCQVQNLYAQLNLVPNNSFENFSGCPHTSCGISLATGWYSAGQTPDYFNTCDSQSGPFELGIPQNAAGYQYPTSGNAYALIFVYPDVREYLATQLISPLEPGVKYFVNFKVSRIDRFVYCATNKIGAFFSTVSYNLGSDSCNNVPGLFPNNFAHVYSTQIITDTANWTTISGSFIADSAYQYIIIGNHFDDNNTDTMCFGSDPIMGGGYFIDDIYVSTDSTLGIMQNNLEQNVTVYPTVTNDIVIVQINIPGKANIKIYDLFGRLITDQIILPLGKNQISLSEYDAGIYTVIVDIYNKRITKKIILIK